MKRAIILLILVILLLPINSSEKFTNTPFTGSTQIAKISDLQIASDEVSQSEIDNISHKIYETSTVEDPKLGEIGIDGTILTSPGDINVAINSPAFNLNWDVSGPQAGPKKYDIYINGTIQASGSYTTSDTITYLFDPSVAGVFNVTLRITSNNGADTDTIFVTVAEFLRFLSTPGNLTFSIGPTQSQIQWIMEADIPGSYWLYQNDTLLVSSTWQDGVPVIAYMPNIVNIYNYTIFVTDFAGNNITDSAYISITAGPALTDRTSQVFYDNETSEIDLYWTFQTSSTPHKYVIYHTGNSSEITNGLWVSDEKLFLNLTDMPIGNYSYSMYVNDTDTEFTWSNITITVDDRPTFTEVPSSTITIQEETTLKLNWTARDTNARDYFVRINDSLVFSSTWVSFDQFNYNFSNFLENVYNLSITLTDKYGLDRTNFVLITVEDNLNPEIISATDNGVFSYQTESIVYTIEAADQHPQTYQVKVNDAVVETGTWSSTIIYTFLERSIGTYTIEFVILDESDNSVTLQRTIEIIDEIAPVLNLSPTNGSIMVYESMSLNWSFSEINPTSFVIETNITQVIGMQGIWSSNENITYKPDLSILGTINITITVNDQSGNSASHSVFINVFPVQTISPTTLETLDVYSGDTNLITGDWVAINGVLISGASVSGTLSNVTNNNIRTTDIVTTDTNGEFQLTLNHTNLDIGDYLWTLEFVKFQYQNQTVLIEIQVDWHSLVFTINPDNTLTQGQAFSTSVEINYADGTGLRANQAGPRNEPASDISFQLSYFIHYMGRSQVETIRISGTTNAQGRAIIVLTALQTTDLEEIDRLEFNLQGNLKLNLQGNTIIENLGITVDASDVVNWFQLKYGFHPFLIVIAIIMIFINPIIRRMQIIFSKFSKLSSKRRFRYYYEMSTIKSILIFNNNGILFYVNQFSRSTSLDPSLIAGLSSAITSFLGEIDNMKTGYGFHKMEKQDLSITIHSGQYSSVAILSSIELTDQIKQNFAEIHKELEVEFVREFERGIGNFGSEDDKKIQTIFEKWDIHVPLMSSITFDRAEVVRVQQESDLSTLIKIELAQLLNKSQGELDGRTYTMNELVAEFSKYGVEGELASKMIYDLYQEDAFF